MTRLRPRVTIERLRTLVLIGGGLLVAAIVAFLALGQWARRLLIKDLPHRLGVDIEQQADGVTYTQTNRQGKTVFKIHAARAVKFKDGGKMELHDVHIDLYGDDGNQADTIAGSEFEYDPNAGIATAAGAVEITLMRPGVKPAIAALKPGSAKSDSSKAKPAAKAASQYSNGQAGAAVGGAFASNGSSKAITDNQIHVKTSGLVFNQKTGVAMTAEHVDFALKQGSGSSIGAVYDSSKGQLVLDRDVVLHAERGVGLVGANSHANAQTKGPVTVLASHAEFERGDMECRLMLAKADYSGGTAAAANALLHFRDDGSVLRLDGSGGVELRTVTGNHVTAPVGSLDFDEANHPHLGLLSGGATIESLRSEGGNTRQIHGTSPTARLVFDSKGDLSLAHVESGVSFTSDQQSTSAKGLPVQMQRTWKSQSADIVFAPVVADAKTTATHDKADSKVEAKTIRGFGGVVVNSETITDGKHAPSHFAADTVVAELAPGGGISSLSGTGHASVDERTAAGVHQASSADQLNVTFVPMDESAKRTATGAKKDGASEIASLVEIGHVVLVQDPAPAAQNSKAEAKPGIRATANRADYDGPTEMLRLTGSPRVVDGPLDMTANRIDFAKGSGDAFAHGDVRASWIGKSGGGTSLLATGGVNAGASGGANAGSASGPVHAIAAEAELHQATQEVIFKGASGTGNLPRLWQAANSVTAPLITLNRQKETLTATGNGAANPVRTVLVTSKALTPSKPDKAPDAGPGTGPDAAEKKKPDSPSTIRVRSGDLHYSEGERLAVFHSAPGGQVTAETLGKDGLTTVVADQAEVQLAPESKRAVPAAGAAPLADASSAPTRALGPANSAIDRLTAQGHVAVEWPGRKGTGDKLVYRGEDGTYTLTGTSSAPPRITDPARGTVTGSALIFHGGDDSVTVEGDGGKTVTETRSKK